MKETLAPFPHPGGCRDCRVLRRCNACGLNIAETMQAGCTNGRCRECHITACVNRGPEGHGYGAVGVAHLLSATLPDGQPHETEGEIAQALNADREPHQAPESPAPWETDDVEGAAGS